MVRHLQREIERLKKRVLALCADVEKNVAMATRAVGEQDKELAQKVIDSDLGVDGIEVEIEEECLKILALHQPVAIDLRVIIAILKINNDLERIGDLAVNIAERAIYLATQKPLADKFDFPTMTDKVTAMLRKGVDALVSMDATAAYKVCEADDEVDELNRHMYNLVDSLISEGRKEGHTLMHLLSVSRHLERIADHATNIAEDVIYMITGDIVRHHIEDYTGSVQ